MNRLLLAAVVLLAAVAPGCRSDRSRAARTTAATDPSDSTWRWVYVPDAEQYTDGEGIVADDGGAWITGYYHHGMRDDGPDPAWGGQRLALRGELNFFVARLGSDGTVRWARRYGDGGRIGATDIARGPDGSLYVVGTMSASIGADSAARWSVGDRTLVASDQTAFIARLDSTGAVRWARLIDGVADARTVAVDSTGHVYVAGGTVAQVGGERGTGPVLADSGDAFLAAYSPDGTPRWRRIVARGGYATAQGIAALRDGVCVVGGFATPDTVTFAGELRRFSVSHGFVAAFDADGNRRWTDTISARHRDPAQPERSIGGGPLSISVNLNAVAADASGACYVAGGFAGVLHAGRDTLVSAPAEMAVPHGHTDAVVVRYDQRGRAVWGTHGIGGPVSDAAHDVAIAPDGRVLVVGDFMGTGSFGPFRLTLPTPKPRTENGRLILPPRGIFVATLDADGTVLGAVQNVPDENIFARGIAVSRDGAIYVTGSQERSAIWGRFAAPNPGINAFVARLGRR